MSTLPTLISSHAARLVAIAAIVLLYGFAKPPQLSAFEMDSLAERFQFSSSELPKINSITERTVREVHPELERISAWISSVGASVALNDLDGDGLSNDVCYVNVRSDQVIVAPVPGTPDRYAAFTLEPPVAMYERTTMAPMGCLPGDVNEDGRMDMLVYYWGRTPILFLQASESERGTPALSASHFIAREVVSGGERWFTNAATFADLNGDGHNDLIIGNYFQDGAQILDANASDPAYMQHSMSRAFNAGRNRILLWSNADGDAEPGTHFREAVSVLDEEVAHGWTLALGAADLDGDLLPEIYFANDFGPDRLLHNRTRDGRLSFGLLTGEKSMTTPSSKIVGRDSFKGMGIDFGDLNADGLLDIYVSNIASEYSLEESHFVYVSTGDPAAMQEGVAPYVDLSEPLGLSRSGWGWESRLADFDNDGVLEAIQATGFVKGAVNRWPELHELAMGNDELLRHPLSWPHFQPGADLSGYQHNPFFVRGADGRYHDLAETLDLALPQVSRGIATADVDGDGDLDFAVANQWEPSRFYLNECPDCDTYLGIHLLLAVADGALHPLREQDSSKITSRSGHPAADLRGRPAVGATATVHMPDGRRLVAQVDGGNGHSGARSPDLHFGLGEESADTQLQVDLKWRDSTGEVHQETISLTPGWHTIVLGD